MLKPEWFKETPISKQGVLRTIDYSAIELPDETTLLAQENTKVLETLWSAIVEIEPIIGVQDHLVLRIQNEDGEEIAHIFLENEIFKIKKIKKGRKYKVIIKTRHAFVPPAYFHEIRYIEI